MSLVKYITKRDGKKVEFDETKIKKAITKTFIRLGYNSHNSLSVIDKITNGVISEINRHEYFVPNVEDIQNIVENVLIKNHYIDAAKSYIIYRERHRQQRVQKNIDSIKNKELLLIDGNGDKSRFDDSNTRIMLEKITTGLDNINIDKTMEFINENITPLMDTSNISKITMTFAIDNIGTHYDYSYLSSRLLLDSYYKMILTRGYNDDSLYRSYKSYFKKYIEIGIEQNLLTKEFNNFDLDKISQAIDPSRDNLFFYLGLKTIFDRYLLKTRQTERKESEIFELPQFMWMRVAMGLALNEKDKTGKTIEFYTILSNMYLVSSTPTLFNSGTLHSQLSSCYINTVDDSLEGIFKNYSDNAQLSKWAGGIGTDWTGVRASGSSIEGTNGLSSGIIPFVKIFNDVALAVNQGGKRKGAMACYLETWHLDIEEYIELRKNTGDERRRAHDIHPAVFISDLFMKRVLKDEDWTLFSPSDAKELHNSFGSDFENKYIELEEKGLKHTKKLPAKLLWRKILTMLYETGHPWITFKDTINVRSPQDHVGVVHSSNLCCIRGSDRALTDKGYIRIDDWFKSRKKHDVVDRQGNVIKKVKMYKPLKNQDIYTIVNSLGMEHTVTHDHKVWVVKKGWVNVSHLVKGDKISIQSDKGIFGKIDDTNMAFLYGIFISDGTYSKKSKSTIINIYNKISDYTTWILRTINSGVLDKYIRTNKEKTKFDNSVFIYNKDRKKIGVQITSRLLTLYFESNFGYLPDNKLSISNEVFQFNEQTTKSFLKGVFITDGCAIYTKDTAVCYIELCSISKDYLLDIQRMLLNCNVVSSVSFRRKGYYKNNYKFSDIYSIRITGIRNVIKAESFIGIFKLRKNVDISKLKGHKTKYHTVFKRLDKVNVKEDVYCPLLETDEHSWICNGMVTKNTEITLNTSKDETAVCNLASVNLSKMIDKENGIINEELLSKTIKTGIRMLDNVIDLNFYPTDEARNSNKKHRPIGLGVMGYHDALFQLKIPYCSNTQLQFADESMEMISYYAILASSELAKERKPYPSYKGSKWDRGILPLDTLDVLEKDRGVKVEVNRSSKMDWDKVRDHIKKYGMSNSNVLAIAPTACRLKDDSFLGSLD